MTNLFGYWCRPCWWEGEPGEAMSPLQNLSEMTPYSFF